MNKTYTETFAVRATDCDFERRMRLDALFVAMQEGGERHALALGGHACGQVDAGGRLADAAFLVRDCDDLSHDISLIPLAP